MYEEDGSGEDRKEITHDTRIVPDPYSRQKGGHGGCRWQSASVGAGHDKVGSFCV